MELQTIPSYFLAANGPNGVCSRFSELYDASDDWQCVILKGGPGSGKSTLMKKAAQRALAAGQRAELIYCSSDPRSLDGVIFPELHKCMADGTAPHVLEPQYPGACERIFDPGDCWDHRMLYDHRAEIRALGQEVRTQHDRAARLRKAAAALLDDARAQMQAALDRARLEQYSSRLCRRLFRGAPRPGGYVTHRFLSGITPDGWITFAHTLTCLAQRIVLLEDDTGIASEVILSRICDAAAAHGEAVVCCLDPLYPDAPDAVILPGRGEAFARTDRFRRFPLVPERTVHTRRFLAAPLPPEVRRTIRARQKQAATGLDEAIHALAQARAVHDRLEACYMAATDYDKLNAKSEALLNAWLG